MFKYLLAAAAAANAFSLEGLNYVSELIADDFVMVGQSEEEEFDWSDWEDDLENAAAGVAGALLFYFVILPVLIIVLLIVLVC